MKIELRNNALPWSFSRLDCWETCPRKFKYRYVQHIKSVPGPAAERGTRLHELCEKYVRGEMSREAFEGRYVPAAKGGQGLVLSHINAYAAARANTVVKVRTEHAVKFDVDYKLLPDEAKDHFGVVIYDVMIWSPDGGFAVVDYKTGRVYEDKHEQQAATYALVAYRQTGMIPAVRFLYLDSNDVIEHKFTPEQLDVMEEIINDDLEAIDAELDFPASPDDHCKWCDYRQMCRGR